MNYKIVDNALVETKTENEVVKNCDMTILRNMKRHLNMGGGFDGFTPSFFFNDVIQTNEAE
jgi:D-alanyl-D-alanine dipeptidase